MNAVEIFNFRVKLTQGTIGIDELSDRAKAPVASIRYYEEIGLLPKAARRNGRHRTYEEADLARLTFVRANRELGFSLEQVRKLIQLSDPSNLTCSEARKLSLEPLATVRKRIADLSAIETELEKHIAVCESLCSCGRAPHCPVLITDATSKPRQGISLLTLPK